MEAEKKKLPHHLSHEYKQMKADGLIDDKGVYVGGQDLEEPNIRPETPQEKEESIPVSQMEAILERMFAERMKSVETPPQQTYQGQSQPQFKQESNIDDIPELRDWEMKDREYELCDTVKPISCSIAKEHTATMALQYTNKETQSVHIMRYATNQPSFFIEKQSKEPGSVLVSDVIFDYGRLRVPANNVTLQKFLAIHPHNEANKNTKDNVFKEYDPLAKSKQAIADKKLKLQANNLVFNVGEITNRAIASLEFPNYVDSWSVEMLEEEVLALSDKTPQKYIDYTNDPTIKMKGVIKASLASGDLIYSNYRFLNKKREAILEIAKNQNEMDELVLYFESGVGRTLYEYLLNRI